MFNIQEFETLKRQGYRILICAMNDGVYGSEFHKLRADGVDDHLAVFGRPPLETIARGFGLRGQEIRDLSVIPKLFADFAAQGESELWNIQISDQVTAPGDPPDHQARPRQYVSNSVMPGLGPGIHVFAATTQARRGWPGRRPAMTTRTRRAD